MSKGEKNRKQKKTLVAQAEAARRFIKMSPAASGPHFDVPGELYLHAKDVNKASHEAVQPHWDGFVDMIRDGKYLDLHKMGEQLQEHRKTAIRWLDDAKPHVNLNSLLHWVFEQEEKINDPETSIHTSLKDQLEHSDRASWGWEPNLSNQAEPSYTLVPTEKLLAQFELEKLINRSHIWGGGYTWAEAKELSDQALSRSKTSLHIYSNLVRLIDFRLGILDSVLWQFEVMGFVPEYNDLGSHVRKPAIKDSFLRQVVVCGLRIYEEEPNRFLNRTQLLEVILREFPKNDLESVRRGLIRKKLYPTADESKRQGALKERRLLEKLIEHWASYDLTEEPDNN